MAGPQDEFRQSAVRAGMVSLVLHAAIAAAAFVTAIRPLLWRPTQPATTSIDTRVMDVSLVLLAPEPPRAESIPVTVASVAPRPLPPIAPPPPLQVAPASHAPAAPAIDSNVQPAGHASPAPPTAPAVQHTTVRQPPDLPPGAVTAFCGVPALGRSVVFVIDRSATMGLEHRLERALRELELSLRRLPPSARFQVIAYNRSADAFAFPGGRGLAEASTDATSRAIEHIGRLAAEGGTDHARALRAALLLQPDVIYFLTDDDELTADQVREITRLNRGRTSIHALCFVEPLGESAMPALARANRGTFRVVP